MIFIEKCVMEGCFAMREKLQRFMYGRYGVDRLNRVLMTVSMVFLVLSIFRVPYAYIVAVLILFYTYYRMLSRQIGKRAAENQWYLKKEMKLRGFFQKKKKEWSQRKQYHIYKCPSCKQKLRVPRGRGKIVVSCRKCGTEFMKNS